MIVLTETTDNLQIVLGGAITTNQLPCFASYRDITTTAYTPGRNAVNTNSGTDVNLVAAPSASTQRVIDFITVFNADTVAATVTIKLDANGTETKLWVGSLGINERLEFNHSTGFNTFTSGGSRKLVEASATAVSADWSTVVLSGDVVNNNGSANTIADVTALSFSVVTGNTYWFEFMIPYDAAATTTGSRWAINGPATTYLAYMSWYSLTTTSATTNFVNAYDTPAASNASSAATTGNMAVMWGFITPSADGTVIARFASEVTSSAITAKAGAIVRYQQVL